MSVSIVSLASGSKGNSTLVFSDDTAILVDAGVSYTRLNEELRKFGLNTAKLDGVVITHEHTDHIAALPRLGRDTRIFAHPKTAQAIVARQGELSGYTEVDFYEGGFAIGDIEVIPFRIPHDAAYPLGYSFRVKSGAQVSVATDMGRPTVGVYNNIRESEAVLIEANHDVDMLRGGSYPEALKRRILGDMGHLSNDMTALFAERLVGSAVRTMLLGHLSENNNLPELALGAVGGRLRSRGCSDIAVAVAGQHCASAVYEVK